MLAVESMDLRDNFKTLCDKAFAGETLIIFACKFHYEK